MLTRLKLLRKERGLSQQQLADQLGVSQQSINKYETRNVQPDLETLKKMADIFHTSIDFLVEHTIPHGMAQEYPCNCLNMEEKIIISKYRTLTEKQKNCLKALLQTWELENI